MDRLLFWKSWSVREKYFQTGIIVLFLITVIIYLLSRYLGTDWVIHWETKSQLTVQKIEIDRLDLPLADLSIMADNFLIKQSFAGSDLQLLEWPSYLFLSIFCLGFILILSIAPSLKRFSYILSQIAIIFLLVGFKLEQLLLFGSTSKWALIAAFILFLPISYYFHSLRPDISFAKRLLVFTGCTLAFALLIHFASGVGHPFLYLVHYGMAVPVIISIIFILAVSHEIIYAFLFIVTAGNSSQSKNSLTHFTLLSVIYLVNVVLLYLKITGRIDWEFYYLDAFWILLVSAVIGVWGLRARRELYENIISFRPLALWAYLAFGIICFATIGYYFATANDAIIEAFEDIIVFGQLGFGIGFFLYTGFNFWKLLHQNLQVYKVVFKPQRMPYFTINFAGLIAVVSFFGMAGKLPYYQTIATYYNGIGDLHAIDDQEFLAKEYYQQGSLYESRNHRSNYAVASMSRQEGERADAIYYFKKSLEKKPTPYAYVNLAELYSQRESFFDAFFILNEGLQAFSDNGQLNNNLGLVYSKTEILDSALYFFNRASEDVATRDAAITNVLAILASNDHSFDLDSLPQKYVIESHLPAENNLLVLANLQGRESNISPEVPSDSTVTSEQFTVWYNYAFQPGTVLDTTYLNALEEISRLPQNQNYSDFLILAQAFGRYKNNQVGTAFSLLEELANNSRSGAGYYFDLLGLWSLQQRSPRLALEYFQAASDAGSINAPWHLAVTLAELGWNDLALSQVNRVLSLRNLEYQEAAELLKEVLSPDSLMIAINADPKIVHAFVHYRWDEFTHNQRRNILDQQPIDFKRKLLMNRFLKAKDIGDTIEAHNSLAQLGLLFNDREKADDEWFAFSMKANDFKEGFWSVEGESSPPLTAAGSDWKVYSKAQQLLEEGNLDEATQRLKLLANKNPFEEVFVLGASRFLQEQPDREIEAYEVLLDAVQANRYSIPLLKAYSLQCLRMNLDTYAQDALERLESLLAPEAFSAFNQQYLTLAQTMQEAEAEWNP